MRKIFLDLKKTLGLSFSLAYAQIKLRNEGSYFGILWYLLEPLSFFVILLLLGNSLLKSNIEKYPLYLFLGLIMFNFFLATTNYAIKVFHYNSNFIKSLKIDKSSFVIVAIIQYAFSHFFELVIFFIFMAYFRAGILGILFYPFLFMFFSLFVLGICFILSVAGVYMVDFCNIWQIAGRFLWFVTPIFYYAPEESWFYFFNFLNPVYYFIYIARTVVIYNKIPDCRYILLSLLAVVAFLGFGIFVFKVNEKKIAEKL